MLESILKHVVFINYLCFLFKIFLTALFCVSIGANIFCSWAGNEHNTHIRLLRDR